jgi:8-amino-7-oxononanoate synthase
MLLEHLGNKLQAIAAQSLTRVLRVAETAAAPLQQVRSADGQSRELLMFCSNDYLGLADHPQLADAMVEGVRLYGAGSGASHLISGHSRAHDELEHALAAWVAPEIPNAQALFFCTGYMANLAVLSALGDAGAEIFSEALNHASLIDGIKLSKASVQRYAHGDVAALETLLRASRARIKLIVTDAVFSMDGDLAPLPELLALAEAHDAWLIVDDAHGFGVVGPQGRGTLAHFQLRSERLILIGTLGKAAGVAGAFVAAHPTITHYLLQAARPYIFTTAAPPALAHALLSSLALMASEEGDARRVHLLRLQARLRDGVAALLAAHPALTWQLLASDTPIQPLVVGDNATVMQLSAQLERLGLRVPGIRPPTVPGGTARLRITLCASHSEADIDRLLQALASVVAEQQTNQHIEQGST